MKKRKITEILEEMDRVEKVEINNDLVDTIRDYFEQDIESENAKIFASIPTVSFEEAVTKYKKKLAEWSLEFNAKNISDLVMKSDMGDLPFEISGDVLMYASFLERHLGTFELSETL
jgi:predicted DNA-binding protein (UPF0251 family)